MLCSYLVVVVVAVVIIIILMKNHEVQVLYWHKTVGLLVVVLA